MSKCLLDDYFKQNYNSKTPNANRKKVNFEVSFIINGVCTQYNRNNN